MSNANGGFVSVLLTHLSNFISAFICVVVIMTNKLYNNYKGIIVVNKKYFNEGIFLEKIEN